jgi:hypothetical protein
MTCHPAGRAAASNLAGAARISGAGQPRAEARPLRLLIGALLLLAGCSARQPTPTPVVRQTSAALAIPSAESPPDPAAASVNPAASNAELAAYADSLRPSRMADLRAHADAPRYDLDLSVDPVARRVEGSQVTEYVNRGETALSELVLRLYPNTAYMGGTLALGEVRVDGLPVTPVTVLRSSPGLTIPLADTSVISLPLASPLQPGARAALTLTYSITAPASHSSGYRTFGANDGLLALPNAYAMIAPRDQDGWISDPAPDWGDIVLSEMALYRARIHAPAGYLIAATGVCRAAPLIGDPPAQDVTCVAGPVRDFALQVGHGFTETRAVVDSQGEPITVTSVYAPRSEAGGRRVLGYAVAALQAYERLLGPYPYRELTVYMSPVMAGGIEYPMLIGITDGLYGQEGGYLEWIVAHEVAHQWWYGLVGNDPVNEAWLDEALTQYTTSLYIEDRYGPEAARQERQRYFVQRYENEARRGGDVSVNRPTAAFERSNYGPLVYGKGPLFFQAVRETAGDLKFIAWLRLYLNQHRYGITNADDLFVAADQVGIGTMARAAFVQWIANRNAGS